MKKTSDLQQEKLVLDLMHAERRQLVALMREQKGVQALKEANQETILDIARQRAALEKREQDSSQREKAAADALAKQEDCASEGKAAIEAESRRLAAETKAAQACEGNHRQTERELAAARAALGACRQRVRRNIAWKTTGLKQRAMQRRSDCRRKSPLV